MSVARAEADNFTFRSSFDGPEQSCQHDSLPWFWFIPSHLTDTSLKMPAEIHDLYDSILILDFGSQVSFPLRKTLKMFSSNIYL
jgi:hypothetical protein